MSIATTMYYLQNSRNRNCSCSKCDKKVDNSDKLHIDEKYPIDLLVWSYEEDKYNECKESLLNLGMTKDEFILFSKYNKQMYYATSDCHLKLQEVFDDETYDRIFTFWNLNYNSHCREKYLRISKLIDKKAKESFRKQKRSNSSGSKSDGYWEKEIASDLGRRSAGRFTA